MSRYWNNSNSDVDSDDEESTYQVMPCSGGSCSRSSASGLSFDMKSIEDLILTLIDKFDFKVVTNDGRSRGAVLVVTGLTLAGGLLGRHYGGKVGAAVGGTIGGACGIGIVAVSMRQLWEEIKTKLWELFDIVYDYLSGLGLQDYTNAARFIIENQAGSTQLALLMLETAGNILGKKILSKITNA